MSRPKKSKVLPDKENFAIRTAEMFKLQKGSFALVHFSAKEVEGISSGIFSLVAERNRLWRCVQVLKDHPEFASRVRDALKGEELSEPTHRVSDG